MKCKCQNYTEYRAEIYIAYIYMATLTFDI